MRPKPRPVFRTAFVCVLVAAAGERGWPLVARSVAELIGARHNLLSDRPAHSAVSFDALIVDLLATAAGVLYLGLVASVLPVVGSAALGIRLPGSRHGWTRFVAVICGLGLSMTPASGLANDTHHDDNDSRITDLAGLPMPDLPAPYPPYRARPVVAQRVTVRPGDTLWRIAGQHLPRASSTAEIARTVAAWYESNRAVIGADPNLIFPGTHLEQPGGHR